MKALSGILVLMSVFFAACASTTHNPDKPEMSAEKSSPRTFNQFHQDWQY